MTYFLDIFSYALIPTLATQKLFLFNLYNFSLIKEDWFKNVSNLTVDEESTQQVFYRRIYFIVLFILLVPFFLQKDMRLAHRVSMVYIGIFVAVISLLLF